jgi:hypothetical protein
MADHDCDIPKMRSAIFQRPEAGVRHNTGLYLGHFHPARDPLGPVAVALAMDAAGLLTYVLNLAMLRSVNSSSTLVRRQSSLFLDPKILWPTPFRLLAIHQNEGRPTVALIAPS